MSCNARIRQNFFAGGAEISRVFNHAGVNSRWRKCPRSGRTDRGFLVRVSVAVAVFRTPRCGTTRPAWRRLLEIVGTSLPRLVLFLQRCARLVTRTREDSRYFSVTSMMRRTFVQALFESTSGRRRRGWRLFAWFAGELHFSRH